MTGRWFNITDHWPWIVS